MFTRNQRRRMYCVLALLTVFAAFPLSSAKAVGTWANGTPNPWDTITKMNLLPNGDILVGGNSDPFPNVDGTQTVFNGWYLYTPDAQGNYTDGTWTQLQPSTWGTLYDVSWILGDGRYLMTGGEYPSDPFNPNDFDPQDHVQTYDFLTNSWTQQPDGPEGIIGDTGAAMLTDGRLLVSNDITSAVDIFDPTTNKWKSAKPLPIGPGDEQNWMLLADGSVLEVYTNPGYRYIPGQDTWLPVEACPISISTALYGDEQGPLTYVWNSNLAVPNSTLYAASDHGPVELFTPPTSLTDPGSWALLNPYPSISAAQTNGADCPMAIEPDGKALMVVSQFNTTDTPEFGPAAFYEYDPSNDTYAAVTDPLGYTTPGYTCRLLNLPNGQIMLTGGQNDIEVYTPDQPEIAAAAPTIAAVYSNGDGSYTLAGTQLSGLWYGSVYGDDEYMATNFPIITLTDASNNVFFCRSYGSSSHGLATGSTLETVKFALPANLPNETFSLNVSVNGLSAASPVQFPGQDFSLANSNDVSVSPGGGGGQTTVTVTPINGFNGSVTIGVTGLPNGVNAQSSSPTTSSTDTITFTANSGAAQGTTQVTITGSFNNIVHSVTLNLSVASSPPGAPAVTAQALDQAVELTWPLVSGASSYNVYRSTIPGGEGTNPIASGVTGTQYVDNNVTGGLKYYYEVAGVNVNGTGAMSSEVSATPVALAPDAPANLVVTQNNGQISLTWNASTLATSYTVSYSTSTGQELSGTQITGITGTSTNVTGLTNGTTYYFVVQGVDTDGTGFVSNEVSATQGVPPPVSPAGLAIPGSERNVDADIQAGIPIQILGGDQQVELGWIPVDTATSYNVYEGSTSGGEDYVNPVMTGVTGSTATVTGLQDGTQYFFTVESVNAGGTSSPSNEVFATPEPPAPAAPVLSGTGGFEVANLTWTAPAEATSYDVYESTTSPAGPFVAIATQIQANSDVVTGLTNNRTYYFEVDAGNLGGVSPLSNVVAVTPQFAAPTNLTATPGDTSVSLSWTATTGASTYDVFMSTTSGGEGAIPIQVGVRGTSFTVLGLTDGTTYYFEVAGVRQSVLSNLSNEVPATPALVIPPAPTGLAATSGDTQVSLSWTSTTPGVTFNVYQGTASGGESATPVQTGLTSPAVVVTGLTDGTTYFFTVAAVNAAGTSPVSNEVSSTPQVPLPPAPTLSATPADHVVNLSWPATTDASTYNVYMGTTSGGEASTPIASGITGLTYQKTNLTDGKTYYFTVKAVNVVGTGPASNEVSAVPNPPPPPAPTVTATAGNAQVSLSWNSVTGATGYNVYVGTSAGGESLTPTASALTVTTYLYTPATNNTKYYFVVRSAGAGGLSSASNEASATPEPPPPAAVTGLTAANGDKQVTLTWTASTGATSYNIYQATKAGGEADPPTTTSTSATSTITGLNDGVKYYFTVTAVNTGGTSAQSAEVSTIPSAPVQFRSGINFFSVPFDYSSVSIDAALGAPTGTDIQLATWTPSLDSYAVTPTPPADHIRLGVGYWSTFASGLTTTAGGTPADPTQDFTINLVAGWNSIGDPFTVSVPLSNLTFNNGTETLAQATSGGNPVVFGTMYDYNQASNSYDIAQSLDPGSGYWVYAFSSTTMTVPHP